MFAERLKQLRKNNKITQNELAEHFGYSHVAVVKWENGTREPDFKTLKELANYFNVSVDYLLGIDNSNWTAEDYANGVRETKKISVTADQEEIFDKTNDVLELLGEKGKYLIIEFCNLILKQFSD